MTEALQIEEYDGNRRSAERRQSDTQLVNMYPAASTEQALSVIAQEWEHRMTPSEPKLRLGRRRNEGGDVFLGEHVEEVLSGRGLIQYSDGSCYVGECFRNNRHGLGVYRYTNGDIYQGEWDLEAKHGVGTCHFASTGDRFEGEYRNNKRVGHGAYTWANGSVQVANFVNGRVSGPGMLQWLEGRIYFGDFERDQREGHGVCFYPNGDVYEGEFKGDLRHGYGSYSFADKDQSPDRGNWFEDFLYQSSSDEIEDSDLDQQVESAVEYAKERMLIAHKVMKSVMRVLHRAEVARRQIPGLCEVVQDMAIQLHDEMNLPEPQLIPDLLLELDRITVQNSNGFFADDVQSVATHDLVFCDKSVTKAEHGYPGVGANKVYRSTQQRFAVEQRLRAARMDNVYDRSSDDFDVSKSLRGVDDDCASRSTSCRRSRALSEEDIRELEKSCGSNPVPSVVEAAEDVANLDDFASTSSHRFGDEIVVRRPKRAPPRPPSTPGASSRSHSRVFDNTSYLYSPSLRSKNSVTPRRNLSKREQQHGETFSIASNGNSEVSSRFGGERSGRRRRRDSSNSSPSRRHGGNGERSGHRRNGSSNSSPSRRRDSNVSPTRRRGSRMSASRKHGNAENVPSVDRSTFSSRQRQAFNSGSQSNEDKEWDRWSGNTKQQQVHTSYESWHEARARERLEELVSSDKWGNHADGETSISTKYSDNNSRPPVPSQRHDGSHRRALPGQEPSSVLNQYLEVERNSVSSIDSQTNWDSFQVPLPTDTRNDKQPNEQPQHIKDEGAKNTATTSEQHGLVSRFRYRPKLAALAGQRPGSPSKYSGPPELPPQLQLGDRSSSRDIWSAEQEPNSAPSPRGMPRDTRGFHEQARSAAVLHSQSDTREQYAVKGEPRKQYAVKGEPREQYAAKGEPRMSHHDPSVSLPPLVFHDDGTVAYAQPPSHSPPPSIVNGQEPNYGVSHGNIGHFPPEFKFESAMKYSNRETWNSHGTQAPNHDRAARKFEASMTETLRGRDLHDETIGSDSDSDDVDTVAAPRGHQLGTNHPDEDEEQVKSALLSAQRTLLNRIQEIESSMTNFEADGTQRQVKQESATNGQYSPPEVPLPAPPSITPPTPPSGHQQNENQFRTEMKSVAPPPPMIPPPIAPPTPPPTTLIPSHPATYQSPQHANTKGALKTGQGEINYNTRASGSSPGWPSPGGVANIEDRNGSEYSANIPSMSTNQYAEMPVPSMSAQPPTPIVKHGSGQESWRGSATIGAGQDIQPAYAGNNEVNPRETQLKEVPAGPQDGWEVWEYARNAAHAPDTQAPEAPSRSPFPPSRDPYPPQRPVYPPLRPPYPPGKK